jgi:hypothetical protein
VCLDAGFGLPVSLRVLDQARRLLDGEFPGGGVEVDRAAGMHLDHDFER